MALNRFESQMTPQGDIEIRTYGVSESRIFLLDSPAGHDFCVDFLNEFQSRYPGAVSAAEQMIAIDSPTVAKLMQTNVGLRQMKLTEVILQCCFGELTETLDFDGETFHMEFPRGCRKIKCCPFCGYQKRNEDTFLCLCGAKRYFGLTETERRVARLLQSGYTSNTTIAAVLCCTKSNIDSMMSRIHKKTNTATLAELLMLLKDERI